ncbi:MAG: arginine repressor [Clostridia bacterium]|nr:arginine repressor [Clostridia bacterium]
MKTGRHQKILEIIEKENIETQDQLIDRLRESGFDTTQATISRDIKQLQIVKRTVGNGTYKYAVQKSLDGQTNVKYKNIIRETIYFVHSAENITVIKTYTGMANAAAAAIDAIAGDLVVGSIAGDDTIFVVTDNIERSHAFAKIIKDIAGI